MSSDLFVLDVNSKFFNHSSNNSPEMAISSSDGGGDLFFSEQLCSSFPGDGESFLDIFQEFKSVANGTTSSMAASSQLQSLTIGYDDNGCRLEAENCYSGGGMDMDVKTEECPMGLESFIASYGSAAAADNNTTNGGVVDGGNNLGKSMMQRSYSGDCFGSGGDASFLFQPRFHYQNRLLSSPESNFLAGQLRRVCSTGDLQNTRRAKTTSQRSLSSPLAIEKSLTEESQLKVGRYSAEERQERISKYRAKRSQRNFNKTIKYACRKTLADNRPRIRGRFARNDEIIYCENIIKGGGAAACSSRDDDEDELWFDGLHEEELGEGNKGSFGSEAQLQFHGY